MKRRLRIQGKYRQPLGEDQLALAFLMLAKQLREDAPRGAEATPSRLRRERRAA